MASTSAPSQSNNASLPEGYVLDQYRIERKISMGGFSSVYLARDEANVPYAIKEYLPNSLALRAEGQIEPVIPEAHLPAFRYGMKCFFEEGRALARLNHPNVIRVVNFFRANGTVYMVMEFVSGQTMQEYIRNRKGRISERFIRTVFMRLLNGLREVHTHKLLHLDIKPANIYLREDFSPVLLDFGAARQALNQDEPMLKPMHTPGYASPEHYGDQTLLGPWSDIYSIGATMYACVVGNAPQRADERVKNEEYKPLVGSEHEEKYSLHLLETIDRCLSLEPLARPQSVYALQKALMDTPNEAPEIRDAFVPPPESSGEFNVPQVDNLVAWREGLKNKLQTMSIFSHEI